MFKSGKKILKGFGDLGTAFVYLLISIGIAALGAAFGHFSRGAVSTYMIYAFMIPLAGGALPFLIRYMRKIHKAYVNGMSSNTSFVMVNDRIVTARTLYHGAIATFTTASIVKGVLEVYGTTSKLMIVYIIAGVVLITAASVLGAAESGGIAGKRRFRSLPSDSEGIR